MTVEDRRHRHWVLAIVGTGASVREPLGSSWWASSELQFGARWLNIPDEFLLVTAMRIVADGLFTTPPREQR